MVRHSIVASLAIAAALSGCRKPPPPLPDKPADPALADDWSGVMPVQPAQHLIFHVRKATDGGAETTLDVPERNLSGFPVTGPIRVAGKVDFDIPSVRFRYEAALDPDGKTLRGTVTQGALPPVPVNLTRSKPTDGSAGGP